MKEKTLYSATTAREEAPTSVIRKVWICDVTFPAFEQKKSLLRLNFVSEKKPFVNIAILLAYSDSP
jgi:hypothetical protein